MADAEHITHEAVCKSAVFGYRAAFGPGPAAEAVGAVKIHGVCRVVTDQEDAKPKAISEIGNGKKIGKTLA